MTLKIEENPLQYIDYIFTECVNDKTIPKQNLIEEFLKRVRQTGNSIDYNTVCIYKNK